MTYVEWLRVRNCLRVLAIILGVAILLILVVRISFNREISSDEAFISHVKMQPGTTVAHSVLPDGTKRTTINDPTDRTTVVIDNLGNAGRHVVITEPSSKKNNEALSRATIGSVHINEEHHGDMVTTTIDTNGTVPFVYYMAFADVVAFIVATLLAAPFAREGDGHLEYALTKPVSREAYALGAISVDLGGVVAASIMTIVALIICQLMFEIPSFDFSGVNLNAILMGVVAPFAWYAFLAACTASLKRGYGAILGFAWPVATLVAVFAIIPWGNSILGELTHNIFWVVSRIDPLSYVSMNITENNATGELTGPAHFGMRLAIQFALFIIYSALAVYQWRRVEA